MRRRVAIASIVLNVPVEIHDLLLFSSLRLSFFLNSTTLLNWVSSLSAPVGCVILTGKELNVRLYLLCPQRDPMATSPTTAKWSDEK